MVTDVTDLDVAPAVRVLESAGFAVHVLSWDATRDVPDEARSAVAALAGYAHLGEEFFATFPDLRWISTASTGTDMVDAAAAAAHGVTVRPLLGASTEEVATHALALMLAVERELPHAADIVRDGRWTDAFVHAPRRLSELTLGVCGLGRIGGRLTELARPVVGRIIGHDPAGAAGGDVDERVGLVELLERSDILSLHLPLTPQTRGMIGAAQIERMPHGATIVNVSRGELIDVDALGQALDDGRLRGAGLDVLDGEPPAGDHRLRRHPRALVTPHVGFLSRTSLSAYEREPAEALVAWWRSTQA